MASSSIATIRVLLMATGDIAIASFQQLLRQRDYGVTICGLVTQPDKPVGRKQIVQQAAIKQLALQQQVTVLQPIDVNSKDSVQQLKALRPDCIIVMAYGQILQTPILQLPTEECVNLHASLLPKYRGSSCIQAAILNGDQQTGVTLMKMAKGLDTGDTLIHATCNITEDTTADTLHNQLAELAADLTRQYLQLKQQQQPLFFQPQQEQLASYAPRLYRQDGCIDWQQPAIEIARRIRAYHSWPGTYSWLQLPDASAPIRVKIFPTVTVIALASNEQMTAYAVGDLVVYDKQTLAVVCGDNNLLLLSFWQMAGKKKSPAVTLLQTKYGAELVSPAVIKFVNEQSA